jgi:hypothetical protein
MTTQTIINPRDVRESPFSGKLGEIHAEPCEPKTEIEINT